MGKWVLCDDYVSPRLINKRLSRVASFSIKVGTDADYASMFEKLASGFITIRKLKETL